MLALPDRVVDTPLSDRCMVGVVATVAARRGCEQLGISYVTGTVRGPAGKQEAVEFLIDSGAMYSLLPEPVWQAIGLVADREMDFSLADGTKVTRSVSECHLTLPQGAAHTPVILGKPGDDQPLLGVVALENLGLVFDPFRRVLHPMRALLI